MLISIEGSFGVGKTTVANGLAATRRAALLLENFEANPFLQAFYQDPTKNTFEAEFAFLLLHFHQLKKPLSPAGSEVIADFHLGKDLLYAELNLHDARAEGLFKTLYDHCAKNCAAPDLIICLSASTDLLLRRIRSRKRGYELDVDPAYCEAVNVKYEQFFASYAGRKLLVPMDNLDFVQDPTLFGRLSDRIDRELNVE